MTLLFYMYKTQDYTYLKFKFSVGAYQSTWVRKYFIIFFELGLQRVITRPCPHLDLYYSLKCLKIGWSIRQKSNTNRFLLQFNGFINASDFGLMESGTANWLQVLHPLRRNIGNRRRYHFWTGWRRTFAKVMFQHLIILHACFVFRRICFTIFLKLGS